MKNAIGKVFLVLYGMTYFVDAIATIFIYFYTIYLGIQYGALGFILTCMLPVISTIYFFIDVWKEIGFFNVFNLVCTGIVAGWILCLIFYSIGNALYKE